MPSAAQLTATLPTKSTPFSIDVSVNRQPNVVTPAESPSAHTSPLGNHGKPAPSLAVRVSVDVSDTVLEVKSAKVTAVPVRAVASSSFKLLLATE